MSKEILSCFGKPTLKHTCRVCGQRLDCYGENTKDSVFLLPNPRPVESPGPQRGAVYLKGIPR